MLHLRSSNGYQNVIALDVFSSVFANTISNFGIQRPNQRQYTPNFNSDYEDVGTYRMLLTEELTGKEYWCVLENISGNNFVPDYPRCISFAFYCDDYVGFNHVNLEATGLYNFEVYLTDATTPARNQSSSLINGLVTSGIAMVHNDNFENDYFQNSQSGVEPLTIPTTISYNG